MPLHFDDRDVVAEAVGLRSALIVSCNMCPAITVAVREKKPFLRLFRNFLKSAPFERYVADLRSALLEKGIRTDIFKSPIPHQWFMCMWTAGQAKKLRNRVKDYDGIVVLGCESATQTVRDAAEGCRCRIIEGMELTGIMNAKLKIAPPLNVCFENYKMVPVSEPRETSSPSG